ncbi:MULTISPECIES: tetratricopeptide repeat protein [unclassified Streptomyces]|uniref:tetratricopeptide repeat protein n=1 Tax=unclassified Streptomyces TaxID=2593676 RepID=UPI002271CEB0|nr:MULTISPECIES: tetratricopeptide repeat protein [unclassified Streptomyces]MCY0923262.1 tetratricopeptide repeat protein [Streptomyces sp. H27-G5]MCY0963088.1 tetratricopeptide repeat protein [Streptomyces sp. H27-H5]
MHRPEDKPAPSIRQRRYLRTTAITVALGVVMFTVGAVGLSPSGSSTPDAPSSVASAAGPARGIEALRDRVKRLPKDPVSWADLGMALVQQARTTADQATYAQAETALRRSLALEPAENLHAEIGMGALAAARHQFRDALIWARKAVATSPATPASYGILADAHTQLGQYKEAEDAVQKMADLRPDSSSLARASYTFELRGDTAQAKTLMDRALRAAGTPGERAFAHTHLSSLALDSGDPVTAVRQAEAGLAIAPRDAGLLEARAKARAATGDRERAVADYTAAIATAPLPQYLLGLGELQQALGRPERAEAQYAVLRAQETLRRATSTPADVDAIYFEADHGDPRQAVTMAEAAVRDRPFIAVHDAYAWALHRAGRDEEALDQADEALVLGTRSALFLYHRGAIHQALGDRSAARRDLQQALALDPSFHPLHAPAAREALRRIDDTP